METTMNVIANAALGLFLFAGFTFAQLINDGISSNTQ